MRAEPDDVTQSSVRDIEEPLMREGRSDVSDCCLAADKDCYVGDLERLPK